MTEVPELQPITVAHARAFWPVVRAELERIRSRCDEEWMPDDVWHEILVGNAYLWTVGTPEDFGGFCIFQVHATPYRRSLHIWCCSENTEARAAEYWPQIMNIAAEASCSHVTIESPRRWQRALPGLTTRYSYSARVN